MNGFVSAVMTFLRFLNSIGLLPDSALVNADRVASVMTSSVANAAWQSTSWPLWLWAAIGTGCLIILAIIALFTLRLVVRIVAREIKGA